MPELGRVEAASSRTVRDASILQLMDDFRSQLTGFVDAIVEHGESPVFLIVDLVGAEYIKRSDGAASLDTFRQTAMASVSGAAGGSEAFAYGELRIVGILPGFDRLKTFALIDKLRRVLPMLAQSFDCMLAPEFDVVEYDPATGVAGLINTLALKQHVAFIDAA
jgi:hypothetical protein